MHNEYVYFLLHKGLNFIKIGRTGNLPQRIKTLQRKYGGELSLLGFCVTDNSVQLERTIQDRFSNSWEFKEWFSPSSELLEFISSDEVMLPESIPDYSKSKDDKITTSLYLDKKLVNRLKNAIGPVSISLVLSKLAEKWLDGETKLEIEPVKNKADIE